MLVVMALVMSFLATIYPAWKAASTDPVQVQMPYVETGELIIEVTHVNKKGDGC